MSEQITSVKINVEKWEILKNNGYTLKDIVDNAFNQLLEITSQDNINLIKLKKEKENELKTKKKQKEVFNININKEIKDIETTIQMINEKIEKNRNEEINKEKELTYKKERNMAFNKIINTIKLKNKKDLMLDEDISNFCEKYMSDINKEDAIDLLIDEVYS